MNLNQASSNFADRSSKEMYKMQDLQAERSRNREVTGGKIQVGYCVVAFL